MSGGAPLPQEHIPLIPLLRQLFRRRVRAQRLRQWFQWTVSYLCLKYRSELYVAPSSSWRSAPITQVLVFLRRVLFRTLAPSRTAEYLHSLDRIDQQVFTVTSSHLPDPAAALICAFLGVNSGHLGPFEEI